jgi:hypothetical protein
MTKDFKGPGVPDIIADGQSGSAQLLRATWSETNIPL